MKHLIALLGLAYSQCATASEADCYDAKIRAKPLAQLPTALSREDGVIVISWPWFVDLKVKKVLEGDVKGKEITALAVLHGAFPSKTRTWYLRRTTAGIFNILRVDPSTLHRCADDVGAAQPYIRPSEGKTLDDYRREGEEAWPEFADDD